MALKGIGRFYARAAIYVLDLHPKESAIYAEEMKLGSSMVQGFI